MKYDKQDLEELNIEIGIAETEGNHERLAEILAPKFAFLRADGTTVDDREAFLQKVKRKEPLERRTTKIDSITFYGNRALVACIVVMDRGRYHNLRLFVRQGNAWQLLGWANEPMVDE